MGCAAALAAARDALVTIGIEATYLSIPYSYVECDEPERNESTEGEPAEGAGPQCSAYWMAHFTEKPETERAREFLATGRSIWNGGMFVWQVQAILAVFRQYQPTLFAALSAAMLRRSDVHLTYPSLEKISVDHAMFGWDDLNAWNALKRFLRGPGENVAVGRHVGIDTGEAILYTTDGDNLIATFGLEDVSVVRTADVTLLVHKDRAQDIKKLVQQLKATPELERYV